MARVRDEFKKSDYYGDALFRHLYLKPDVDSEYRTNPAFQSFLESLSLPPLPSISRQMEEEGTVKFLMDMGDSHKSESVLIPMNHYSTLCVSSQIGCRYACRFCATGQQGWTRDLTTAEIMAQLLRAQADFPEKKVQNIVFMGMGEPFDNFKNVMESIDILSDERGVNIPKRRISISTAGHADGIRDLSSLCRKKESEHYHTLHLSLSLHSALDETRKELMPISRKYPLDILKKSLLDSPYSQLKDGLYIEYLIIPGVTDRQCELEAIKKFLEGMEAKINLIPYNPVKGSPWRSPHEEEINSIWNSLKDSGYYCRTRRSKGENMMAACGQLGSRSDDNE